MLLKSFFEHKGVFFSIAKHHMYKFNQIDQGGKQKTGRILKSPAVTLRKYVVTYSPSSTYLYPISTMAINGNVAFHCRADGFLSLLQTP